MSEETEPLLARIAELEELVRIRDIEHEQHLNALRNEQRQLGYHCEDLLRMIDLYRWQAERPAAPPLSKQTSWQTGIFDVPGQCDERRFFNPSIVRFKGTTWLVTRRHAKTKDIGYNDIVFFELTKSGFGRKVVANLPRPAGNEHNEDPRAFVFKGDLYLSCCTFIVNSCACQVLYKLDDNFSATETKFLQIGGNGPSIKETHFHEKNWTWFSIHGDLHLIYQLHPTHKVIRIRDGKTWETTDTNPLYAHGQPRGGSCPVRVGDEFFAFFHSSGPWKANKRQYFMAAYAFSADPPFNITRMSTLPILHGSPHEPMNRDSPLVVFPGGALLKRDEWFVVYGINDHCSGWIKIPHNDLTDTMRKVV